MNDFDKIFYTIVGRKLRELRNKKNFTLTEVAERLEVTSKTIQRYETGERKIDIPVLSKLLEIYHVGYYGFIEEVQREQYSKNTLMVKENSDTYTVSDHYYINDETLKVAEEVYNSPELQILFDASRNADPEDLLYVAEMVRKLKAKEKG